VAHPNEQVLRSSTEALLTGDLEVFLSHYTDDVVVHAAGKNPGAGDHHGKQEFAGIFRLLGEIYDERPRFENHDILANDEHGVVLNIVHFQKGGRSMEGQQIVICHFRDRKISEVWVSFRNQYEVDEFASQG
jgi:ketosteroid isomerase-like protein